MTIREAVFFSTLENQRNLEEIKHDTGYFTNIFESFEKLPLEIELDCSKLKWIVLYNGDVSDEMTTVSEHE